MNARSFLIVMAMALGLVRVTQDQEAAHHTAVTQEPSQNSGPHVIEAGTNVRASPLRAICNDTFAVGDTVSAKVYFGRAMVSIPKWWPKEFTVVLRRSAPDREALRFYPSLTLVGARIDGTVVKGARGVFSTDVESTYRDRGKPDVLCYWEFDGVITRKIRGR